ncbi:Hint domain-containing protein [Pseudosulfitobacter sp. DSM 107133]|uniref:Hint domain-containing protein n=1 Tax=Pseudosulfitobacter sp. DSM 107133 TaxID=2883100 RepID=UPI0013B4043A|nr:Hint domain-containing protein [Pseudosulfitobacter sp. DSM 107133]UOA27836.1 hypothetical protein DSM107133_02575 [Pseudosulfitobacter sp. DSM 107133]
MAIESVSFFGFSQMNTSNWGAVMSTDGWAWNIGSDWISLNPAAAIDTLSVHDDDTTFGDDDLGQYLWGLQTLDGQFWGHGTIIENEYLLTVEDSLGDSYKLAAVSLNFDAFNVRGYCYVGAQPPSGEPLTIVSVEDFAEMAYSPVCFTPGTMIETEQGAVPVESLAVGDRVWTLDNGYRPVRVIASRRFVFGSDAHPHKPIQICAGALGGGLPEGDLMVSPQHRMLLPGGAGQAGVLVPAKALTELRGVRQMQGCREVDYIHLVLSNHEIVLANGALSETLLAGEVALAALDTATRMRVLMAVPSNAEAQPARRILTVREGRALVREQQGAEEFGAGTECDGWAALCAQMPQPLACRPA